MTLSLLILGLSHCSKVNSLRILNHIPSSTVSGGRHTATLHILINSNNNNNNYYYYYYYELKLGYHPVAVVILHAHKYEKKETREFKSGRLHERH